MSVSTSIKQDDRAAANGRAVGSERLEEALSALRLRKDDLRARSVAHLWVFGPVARGEDHTGSDIDLLVEMDPEARLSLTAFARLQLDLADILERPVDLATWTTLREHVVEAARRDVVSVF